MHARTACAPSRASRQGSVFTCRSTPRRSIQCIDGVVVDLSIAVAVAVVGLQHRNVVLRAAGVLERLGRSGHGGQVADAVDAPLAALALECLGERRVGIERVVVNEWRRLVEHLVRRRRSTCRSRRCHLSSPDCCGRRNVAGSLMHCAG